MLLLSAASLLAVMHPVMQNFSAQPRDDFPLSYYPMFSHVRNRVHSMVYLVGVDDQGRRHVIPYTYAGSGGYNQIRKQINRYVRAGQADLLCEFVAGQLARRVRPELQALREVRVMRGRFSLAEYFAGNRRALSEETLASCPLPDGP
jgi:hypothetical protein